MTSPNALYWCQLMKNNYFEEAKNFAAGLVYENPTCEESVRMLFASYMKFGEILSAERVIRGLKALKVPIDIEDKTLRKFKKFTTDAEIFYNSKQYENCLSATKHGLEIGPLSIELRLFRAKSFLRSSKPNEAKAVLSTIEADHPDNLNLNYLKGLVHYFLDELEESLEFMDKAIEDKPEDHERVLMRNKIFDRLESMKLAELKVLEGKNAEAVAIYSREIQKCIGHDSWTAKLKIQRAKAHCSAGNYALGISDVDDAIMLMNSPTVEALNVRAQCFYGMENFKECINDCENSQKIQPNKEAKDLMGYAMEKNQASVDMDIDEEF